jgi:hypothetical protein
MGKRLLVAILLATGAGGGWAAAQMLELLVNEPDARYRLPPCFEVGAPFHHRFRAGCAGMEETPEGPVPFSVNEDGLRDAPRAQLLQHPRRVLVLGDSSVEGWWVAGEQALPAMLGARIPKAYFVNAGLRSTGPLMQAARLASLLPKYKPTGVLWVLNGTDGADDRLACALLKDPGAPAERQELGVDDFAYDGGAAGRLLEGTPLGDRLRRAAYEREWKKLVSGPGAARCAPCAGVREFARIARAARVPVLAAYLPGNPFGGRSIYEDVPSPRESLTECLRAEGIGLLTPVLGGGSDTETRALFWEDDFHLDAAGLAAASELLEPPTRSWLGVREK